MRRGFSRGRQGITPRLRRHQRCVASHRTTYPRRKPQWSDIDATKIHVTKLAAERESDRPLGFCVDIGAPKSVIGRKELARILRAQGLPFPTLRRSYRRFRFADTTFKSLGQVSISLATPPGIPPLPVVMDVVEAEIPALLGLDMLDKELLTADTVTNRLTKRKLFRLQDGSYKHLNECSVPLIRAKSNHVYAEMDLATSSFFTKPQLAKLHRQFFHPSASKLFNLLRRARPADATPQTLSILKELTKRCDPCQRIQNAPTRFRVSFGAGKRAL